LAGLPQPSTRGATGGGDIEGEREDRSVGDQDRLRRRASARRGLTDRVGKCCIQSGVVAGLHSRNRLGIRHRIGGPEDNSLGRPKFRDPPNTIAPERTPTREAREVESRLAVEKARSTPSGPTFAASAIARGDGRDHCESGYRRLGAAGPISRGASAARTARPPGGVASRPKAVIRGKPRRASGIDAPGLRVADAKQRPGRSTAWSAARYERTADAHVVERRAADGDPRNKSPR